MSVKLLDRLFWVSIVFGLLKMAWSGLLSVPMLLIYIAGLIWCLTVKQVVTKYPTRPIPFLLTIASVVAGLLLIELSSFFEPERGRSGILDERADQIVLVLGYAVIAFGMTGAGWAILRNRLAASSDSGEVQ